MMTLKQRERQSKPEFAFAFNFSFFPGTPKVEQGYISKPNSKAVTVANLYSFSTTLVRIKYIDTYELQNTNCIIQVIQLTSEMFLQLYVKLPLHIIKMNGKSHANTLEFQCLYLE